MSKRISDPLVAICAAAMLVIGTSAYADDLRIDPAGLLSMVEADWNADGRPDKAMLLKPATDKTDVELRIYLSDDSAHGYQLASRHQNIARLQDDATARPQLSVNTSGVILRAGNSASASTPWHEVLAISLREKAFVVSRYTITWHDKRDLSAGFRCDLNLINGSGIRNTSSLDIVPAAVALTEWRRDVLPAGCRLPD